MQIAQRSDEHYLNVGFLEIKILEIFFLSLIIKKYDSDFYS